MLSLVCKLNLMLLCPHLLCIIRNSGKEDIIFITIEQHPNFITPDELHDVRSHENMSLNKHLMRLNEFGMILLCIVNDCCKHVMFKHFVYYK